MSIFKRTKKAISVDDLSIMMLAASQGLEQGVEEKVLRAIDGMKNVDERGASDGRTLLMHCSFYNCPSVLCTLIDRGADLNLQDDGGFTALHAAVNSGNYEITKILLDHGARTDIRDSYGNPPLLRASHRFPEIVKLLVEHGCDVHEKNNYGVCAFDMFAAYPDILEILGD